MSQIHGWTQFRQRLAQWIAPRARAVTDEFSSNTIFSEVLHLAADAIILIDDAQRIIQFNRGAEQIFGYSAAAIHGQPLERLLPPRFATIHQEYVRQFAADDSVSRLMGERSEVSGLRSDGTEFPAEASIAKIRYGDQMHFVVILRDVTERKQAEEAIRKSEERFRRMFNYSNDAIFMVDPVSGQFVDVNPKACSMFGYVRDEFLHLTMADIHPKGSHRFKVFAQSVAQQGIGWTDELICLTKAGRELPTELSASMVAFGDRTLMIALFRDITERKQLEQMKDAFVSNVTHELRTPIASIKLMHELLGLNPSKQQVYLERLSRETDRLNHIVEDLLRLSRLDQKQVNVIFRPLDLNQLAVRYVEDREVLAASEQLELTFDPTPDLPSIEADEGLIGQALSILLTNAINYTPPGGCVTICTQADRRNGQSWVGLCVSDTGPGITLDEQKQLFQRFFRGQAAEQSGHHGTGLGLAIANEIIKRHGGSITIESTGVVGEGATFTVWLPVIADHTPA